MNAGSLLVAEDGRLRAIWRAVLGLAVFFVAFQISPMAASLVGTRNLGVREAVSRCLLLAILLGGFSLLLIGVDGVQESPISAMGLPFRKSAWRQIGLGFCFGAGMVTLAVILMKVIGKVWIVPVGPIASVLKPAVMITFILVIAAMTEELAFRGYPFQRLVESIGAVGATVFTSVAFAALHLGNPHATAFGVINTAAVGVLFALAYLRTRSLWLPWAMHFAWNFTLGLIFGLPVSGLTVFAVVTHGSAMGPSWLTGGDYGIEASATGTLVILLGIVALEFLLRTDEVRHETQISPPPAEQHQI
jgi:uncharacterized protein